MSTMDELRQNIQYGTCNPIIKGKLEQLQTYLNKYIFSKGESAVQWKSVANSFEKTFYRLEEGKDNLQKHTLEYCSVSLLARCIIKYGTLYLSTHNE